MKPENIIKILQTLETESNEEVSQILNRAISDIKDNVIFKRMHTKSTPFMIKQAFSDEEISFCLDGHYIEAIKRFRERTGCPVTEAKKLANHVLENPEKYSLLIEGENH